MQPLRSRIVEALARPTAVGLLAACGLLAASDWASRLAGDSVIPGGPLDECAHLMTMLLVLWACGPRISRRLAVGALVASVAIDADHIPQHLGTGIFTVGTPRPYTHSLLTEGLVLLVALMWPGRRVLWLGVAAGLAVHFWRDMSESGAGVSLWWPVSHAAMTLPHWSYALVMAGVVAVIAGRLAAARAAVGHASSHPARL